MYQDHVRGKCEGEFFGKFSKMHLYFGAWQEEKHGEAGWGSCFIG